MRAENDELKKRAADKTNSNCTSFYLGIIPEISKNQEIQNIEIRIDQHF